MTDKGHGDSTGKLWIETFVAASIVGAVICATNSDFPDSAMQKIWDGDFYKPLNCIAVVIVTLRCASKKSVGDIIPNLVLSGFLMFGWSSMTVIILNAILGIILNVIT